MPDPRPIPISDADTAAYWAAARRGKLAVRKCRNCGECIFPPLPRCNACLGPVDWVEILGSGVIYSFCIAHMNLIPGFTAPYAVVQVELDGAPGVRVVANIRDCPLGALRIGAAVDVYFEDRGPNLALPQFRVRDVTESR